MKLESLKSSKFEALNEAEMQTVVGGQWVKKVVWDWVLGKFVDILVWEFFGPGPSGPNPAPNPNVCDNV